MPENETRKCVDCSRWLPLSDYYKDSKHPSGKEECCKPCARARRANGVRKYGPHCERGHPATLTPKEHTSGILQSEYLFLLQRQNGVCAICAKTCTSGRKLAVDHCHTTGLVRGLLCMKCNIGLGHFRENPLFLASAITYVQRGTTDIPYLKGRHRELHGRKLKSIHPTARP